MIAIVTVRGDIHAHAIKHEIEVRHGVKCHLIEVDRLSSEHHVEWQLSQSKCPDYRIRCDNSWVAIGELDVVWWRRFKSAQKFDTVFYPSAQESIINNDCRSSFFGGLVTSFSGYWVSHPYATEHAGNKLYQLSLARQSGFRVPQTLISQNPESVRQFVSKLPLGHTIVKSVTGGNKEVFLFTQFVTGADLESDASIKVCPAIYQEYIPGEAHIRLNCFGDASVTLP